MTKETRQYGAWTSPISPKALAGSLRLNDVQWDSGDPDTLVWLEGRGAVGTLVVQEGVQAPRDLTPGEMNVRALVGYGGGDFTVASGQVYFAGPEGRLYRLSLSGGAAHPITPAFGQAAAPAVSPDGQWLVYVHTYEDVDGLALVDTEGRLWPRKLAYGTDFVMQPTWHPKGTHLAYIAWDNPQMPWDGTELRLATMGQDSSGAPVISETRTIAGNTTTAIFQPEFSPDGRYLTYISDRSGWGQLYLYDLKKETHTALTDVPGVEHSAPAWIQGLRVYGWTANSKALYFTRNRQGFFSLWRCEIRAGKPGKATRIAALEHYTLVDQIAIHPQREAVALRAGASAIPTRIVSYEEEGAPLPERLSADPDAPTLTVMLPQGMGEQIHRRSTPENIPIAQLSKAQAVEWMSHDGEKVYGLYYPPASQRFESGGTPPLIVISHGGPTSQVVATYHAEAQFLATRGYAVLYANYRGSTGYGKPYMDKLRASWGIYDVEDCASGATALVAQGLADRSKLVIMGGSAGGYTVLQSLVDKPGFYKAGVCLFGVSNQFTLASDTHKFEARYSDSLLGPLPEAAALYRQRSPIFHAHKIVDPVILFQGEDDKVVPKAQADSIVAALIARGVPHEYHVYAGEGHGWRKPETIEAYLNSLTAFLKEYVVYA